MLPLLIGLLNRFRPREGWVPFLLVLTALVCPPAALTQANEDLDTAALMVLTALALLVGLRLARSRLSAGRATVIGGVAGGCLVVILVGQLLPPLSLLWDELIHAADWFARCQRGIPHYPLPFASMAGFLWQRLQALGLRLWWWGQTAASGGPAQDPIAFLLLACCLAWIFGCFATWQIYRRRSALLGLLPSGAAVAATSFFSAGLATFYLMVYLLCTLGLIATCHFWTQRDRWQQTDTDYPDDLGLELAITVSPALTLLLLVGTLFPVIHPAQVTETFWELMDGPWSTVERASERLFGPVQRGGPASTGWAGSLPRAHLLGGGPELEATIALYVRTNDPPPPLPDPAEPEATGPLPARRYWRSATFDAYTGQGWTNGPLEERTWPASQILDQTLPAGFELVQQFEKLAPGNDEIYAANAALRIDHAVQGWWRGPGDFAELTSGAQRYTAVSRPPQPSIGELRNAPSTVPPSIAERYLALPNIIPPRVLDLAREVADQAQTRYDQARAIETYLRAYTYTLDLPAPPTDIDLVDYFLFEKQEGYCDFYASAMVVMARAVGIPARLSTGYAQGTYDHDAGRWVVTERDGHSWVEIYFDGIGWIEYEPTAGQPALDRPGGGGATRPQVPPLPPRSRHWWQPIPLPLMGMGAVLILAIILVIWIWRPHQQRDLSPARLVVDRYARLLNWGKRLRQPLQDGQTPSEYHVSLSEALRSRAQDSRWSQVRQSGLEASHQIGQLTEAFIRAQYSAKPITPRDGWQIRDLWIRLRRRLWWLWLRPP